MYTVPHNSFAVHNKMIANKNKFDENMWIVGHFIVAADIETPSCSKKRGAENQINK